MMKREIMFVAILAVTFLFAQGAFAFPGERLPYKAAHFADRVAYKIDRHVIHPVVHGIDRHLR